MNRRDILILWRRALIAITAVGAIAASFIFLTDLAIHAGWHPWAAWLLPFCVDALAAMALTIYRLTGNRAAATISVLVIAFSALGNAASHWFTTGLLDDGWSAEPFMTPLGITVTVVGAVPAVALGLCVHLATKEGPAWTPRNDDGAGSSAPVSSSATPHETTIPAPSGAAAASRPTPSTTTRKPLPPPKGRTSTSKPTRTVTDLASQISRNDWQRRSGNELASLLSVSKTRALQARQLAQAGESQPHPNGQPSNPDQTDVLA